MTGHVWRFFRAGGFDQVRIETGADLFSLDELDRKLWVALACPVTGIEFDGKSLAVLDLDGDGRIRVDEILDTVAWLKRVLRDADALIRPGDQLPLAAIRTDNPEGRRILAAARRMLASHGKDDSASIAAADALDREHLFDQTDFNGDGVIPASAAADPALAALIEDIIATQGAVTDRSGKPGIDGPRVAAFYDQLATFAAWWDGGAADPACRPLGADSDSAYAAVAAVADKIDEFFERCRLSAYSPAAAAAANPPAEFFAALAQKPLAEAREPLTALALAEVASGAALPLGDRLNPLWQPALAAFRAAAVTPLLGARDALSEADWRLISERFAAYGAWRRARPATPLDSLGEERLLAIRALDARAELERLLAADLALADEADAIDEVLRLLLLRRDFFKLVNNFVSFREFYAGTDKALFQAGTLYLDGRSCALCVKVANVEKHVALAHLSRIHLVYCECRRRDCAEVTSIAAAFTAGDSDQLIVGRNGVFYDRSGRDWDATVVKIIDHPISLAQAFLAPYKQLVRFIGQQLEKLAQSKSKTVGEDLGHVLAAGAAKAPPAGKPAEPAPFDIGRFAGVFAAIGLAVGAIGTAAAQIVSTFFHLAWWQMPLAMAAVVAAVSGPSMAIAYFKLRQRDLAPLLDANGWAVNGRVKINIPFGSSLTAVARMPEGAERSLQDPYAEHRWPWRWLAAIPLLAAAAAAALWWLGRHYGWHR